MTHISSFCTFSLGATSAAGASQDLRVSAASGRLPAGPVQSEVCGVDVVVVVGSSGRR